MKKIFKYILLPLLSFSGMSTFAATCDVNASGGSWSSASTWSCGRVPTSSDSVRVTQNRTLNVDIDTANIQSFRLNSSKTLNISFGTNGKLNIAGTTQIDSSAVISLSSGSLNLDIGGNLTNSGTINTNWQTGNTTIQVDGNVTNSGTITLNQSTLGSLTNLGTLTNNGSISIDGAGVNFITNNVINNNNIDFLYTNNTLSANSFINNAGAVYKIAPNAKNNALNINGTLTNSGRIIAEFSGSGSTKSATGLATNTGEIRAVDFINNATGIWEIDYGSPNFLISGDIINNNTTKFWGYSFFTLNGTTNQSVTGMSEVYSFSLDNLAGAILNSNMDLGNTSTNTGALVLKRGKLDTSNTASIGYVSYCTWVSDSQKLFRTAGSWVSGRFRNKFPPGESTKCTFPIGDENNYNELLVNANSWPGNSEGDVIAKVINGDHVDIANSGIDSAKSVNKYWSIEGVPNTLFQSSKYNAIVKYCPAISGLDCTVKDTDSGVNSANLIGKFYSTNWSSLTKGTTTANTIQFTDLDKMGHIILGEAGVPAPPLTCIADDFSLGLGQWNVAGNYTPNIVNIGGSNRLRLTDNGGNRTAFAQFKRWYPGAGNKVVVEFNYYVYGGNGADGLTMVLSDASIPPNPGGYGGSLGYANYSNPANTPGFAGGWLAVGLDEYGNFPNPNENRRGYPSGYTPPSGASVGAGFYANNISIRGSGSGTSGYWLLANTGTLTNRLWTSSNNSSTVQRIRVTVDHSNNVNAWVKVERDTTGTGTSYSTVINNFDIKGINSQQAAVPANWLISFTSGTGGSNNNHEISMLSVCANYSTPPGGASDAANFSVLDSTALSTWNATARKPLLTKLSGTNFTLDVAALKNNGELEDNYIPAGGTAKPVTLELFDYNSATTCSAYASPIATQTVTFSSGVYHFSPGRVTSGNFNIATSHKEVIARVTDNNGTTPVIACSSDTFTIRPTVLSLFSTTASADTMGLSNTNTPTIKTGEAFSIVATASRVGYNGTPKIDNNKIEWLNPPTSGRTALERGVGSLAGTFISANATNGRSSGTFIYDEVGYFRFQNEGLYDDNFVSTNDITNGDCNSGFGNTLVSNKYGCSFGNTSVTTYLGRFIPAGFRVVTSSVINRVNEPGGITSSFTYLGENLRNNFTLEAINHNGQVTKNYSGVRFDPSVATNYNFKASTSTTNLTSRITDLASVGNWSGGVLPASLTFNVNRSNSPNGPHAAKFSIAPVDVDGVQLLSYDVDSDLNTINDSKLTGNTNLYFGAMKLYNASGSDLTKLPIKIEVQYYNGFGFIVNSNDNLTTFNSARFVNSNFTNNLTSNEVSFTYPSGSIVAGVHTLTLNKPSGGDGLYNGSFKIRYDLTADSKSYLKSNWTGSTADYTEDSNSVISLSRNKAKKGMIFIIENY